MGPLPGMARAKGGPSSQGLPVKGTLDTPNGVGDRHVQDKHVPWESTRVVAKKCRLMTNSWAHANEREANAKNAGSCLKSNANVPAPPLRLRAWLPMRE